ncbi:MAG: peroxide stress protein YaaA [Chitinophagales bacterium]
MLTLLSPAKTLDFETSPTTEVYSQAVLLEDTQYLVKKLKKMSVSQIGDLMHLSEKLADLNHHRYANFHTPFTPDNAKQAILAFKGDVYVGLDAESFSAEDFDFAQDHLRILSGLYGLLRPLDLMQAYRLEMGTKLKVTPKKNNLYKYWDTRITKKINEILATQKEKVLINLASNEYFKAVKPKLVGGRILTPVFKDFKNGQYKVISFFAKKARGSMARYIIQNRIANLDDIKAFDTNGYYYKKELSKENEWVFVRD